MSAQNISEVFGPIELRNRERVLSATWGHLAPRRNRTYKGFIVFAVGCFGDDPLNPVAIQCEFRGLDSSPWFFDFMNRFLGEQGVEAGCVYRFDGVFRNYSFDGKVKKLTLR